MIYFVELHHARAEKQMEAATAMKPTTIPKTNALRALDAAKVAYEVRCYDYTEHGGTIQEEGTPDQIFAHPQTERLRSFLAKVL